MIQAAATLISGKDDYFLAAVGQKILLDKHCPQVPHVVMVTEHSYSDNQRRYLQKMGCIVKDVPQITPRHKVKYAAFRWTRVFSKLYLWNLTDYEHIMYMDVDAYPFSDDAYPLLATLEPDFLSATTYNQQVTHRFSSAVMVIRPDVGRFNHLLFYMDLEPDRTHIKIGDQGLLNRYVEEGFGTWDKMCYHWHTNRWPKNPINVIIGHLRPKPWDVGNPRQPTQFQNQGIYKYINIWKNAIIEAEETYGPIPTKKDI